MATTNISLSDDNLLAEYVPLERFKPRVAAPVVIGTPSRMLASYVVLQNHLPMMADYPSAYRSTPLTRVVAAVPATWDETRALAASFLICFPHSECEVRASALQAPCVDALPAVAVAAIASASAPAVRMVRISHSPCDKQRPCVSL